MRKHSFKKVPLIVDFVDSPFVFENQFEKRLCYYESLGGAVTRFVASGGGIRKSDWKRKRENSEENNSEEKNCENSEKKFSFDMIKI